ncbi:MAG TPA: glycosyltransferase family 4 protein [Candidatus Ozemobacteraceae bacterium]
MPTLFPDRRIPNGRKIRVAWLLTPVTYGMGGTWKHVSNWARGFDRERFECCLFFCPTAPEKEQAIMEHFAGFPGLVVIPVRGLYPVSRWIQGGLLELYAALKNWKPDILHSIFLQSDIAAALVGRRAGIQVHISSWESDPCYWLSPGWKYPLNNLGFNYSKRRIDRVIVITSHMRRLGIDRFRIPASRISQVPVGLPLEDFPRRKNVEICERPSRSIRIGTIARLSPEKLVDTIIRAIPLVLKVFPDARFIIAGDGPEKSRLEQLAADLGVGLSTEFIGWQTDIGSVLQNLDIFLFTSRAEGLPLAVLEAQAAMVPTIASSVGGVPDIIRNGENGLLLSSAAPEELSTLLLRLIGDRLLASSLAENGRKVFESRFLLDIEMARIQDIYLELWERAYS